MKYYKIEAEIGVIQIEFNKNVITSITFSDDNGDTQIEKIKIKKLYKKLKKYKYIEQGTDFQKIVWNEIKKIPFGETKTYQQIANNIGKPNSCRAVANACGKNNLALLIPCHRVVGKNDLGGYKWNINRKIKLLELEKSVN